MRHTDHIQLLFHLIMRQLHSLQLLKPPGILRPQMISNLLQLLLPSLSRLNLLPQLNALIGSSLTVLLDYSNMLTMINDCTLKAIGYYIDLSLKLFDSRSWLLKLFVKMMQLVLVLVGEGLFLGVGLVELALQAD